MTPSLEPFFELQHGRSEDEEDGAEEDQNERPHHRHAGLRRRLFGVDRAALPAYVGLNTQDRDHRVAALFGLNDGADEVLHDVGGHTLLKAAEHLNARLTE